MLTKATVAPSRSTSAVTCRRCCTACSSYSSGQRGSAGAEPGLAQGLRRQEAPEAPLAQATRARQADFVRVRAELLTDVLGHRAASRQLHQHVPERESQQPVPEVRLLDRQGWRGEQRLAPVRGIRAVHRACRRPVRWTHPATYPGCYQTSSRMRTTWSCIRRMYVSLT
ncbi:hypothetical protein ON010_g7925 [Phytophthora cinnamomi]|nr:hypothetical protein ON010_g7925 [Phytophthora cinnamomi]